MVLLSMKTSYSSGREMIRSKTIYIITINILNKNEVYKYFSLTSFNFMNLIKNTVYKD